MLTYARILLPMLLQVGKFLGMFGGTPVDAFNYWSQQVEEATSALSDAQREALESPLA